MRAHRRQKQNGIALLMVLIALTILGAMTADLMETNEVYLATTVNARDSVQAEYLARSGVNLSRLLLSFQRLMGQAVNFPFWQYADLVIEMFTNSGDSMMSDLAGINLSEVEGLGLGIEKENQLMVTIIDEDSKINVNMANTTRGNMRAMMMRNLASMMAPVGYDHLFDNDLKGDRSFTREDIICEIMDWSDPDDELCDLSGSEDPSFYQMLTPPYERKNAPFDSLAELHLVQGVDDDFWSAFVEPNPLEPDKRIMTVWGKGRINVNTAPMEALVPVVCMLATDPQSGMSLCQDPNHLLNLAQILQAVIATRGLMPFKKTTEFIAALKNPEKLMLLALLGTQLPVGIPLPTSANYRHVLSTQSTVFSIYAEGNVGKVTKKIHTVVDMKSKDILMLAEQNSVSLAGGKVLYWRME